MEPHSRCHVRAISYSLLDADVVFFFVSDVFLRTVVTTAAAAWNYFTFIIVSRTFGRREMSRVSDLAKRFEEATAYTSVNLSSLKINKLYPNVHAKRSTTKYGPTVLLSIRVSETSTDQVFIPKCYSAVISDDDMDKINSKAVSLTISPL